MLIIVDLKKFKFQDIIIIEAMRDVLFMQERDREITGMIFL